MAFRSGTSSVRWTFSRRRWYSPHLPGCLLVAVPSSSTAGPVFYAQERVGINRLRRERDPRPPRNGARRTVRTPLPDLKVPQMVMDAERNTGPVWASACDSRVTRIGRFSAGPGRREPQLWKRAVAVT